MKAPPPAVAPSSPRARASVCGSALPGPGRSGGFVSTVPLGVRLARAVSARTPAAWAPVPTRAPCLRPVPSRDARRARGPCSAVRRGAAECGESGGSQISPGVLPPGLLAELPSPRSKSGEMS